jgi:hypothetical protein
MRLAYSLPTTPVGIALDPATSPAVRLIRGPSGLLGAAGFGVGLGPYKLRVGCGIVRVL